MNYRRFIFKNRGHRLSFKYFTISRIQTRLTSISIPSVCHLTSLKCLYHFLYFSRWGPVGPKNEKTSLRLNDDRIERVMYWIEYALNFPIPKCVIMFQSKIKTLVKILFYFSNWIFLSPKSLSNCSRSVF